VLIQELNGIAKGSDKIIYNTRSTQGILTRLEELNHNQINTILDIVTTLSSRIESSPNWLLDESNARGTTGTAKVDIESGKDNPYAA